MPVSRLAPRCGCSFVCGAGSLAERLSRPISVHVCLSDGPVYRMLCIPCIGFLHNSQAVTFPDRTPKTWEIKWDLEVNPILLIFQLPTLLLFTPIKYESSRSDVNSELTLRESNPDRPLRNNSLYWTTMVLKCILGRWTPRAKEYMYFFTQNSRTQRTLVLSKKYIPNWMTQRECVVSK